MSATTATLNDILYSELKKLGHDEFFNEKGEFIFFDDQVSFMNKIMTYDEDVSKIVNDLFFYGQKLSDPKHDKHFKYTFLMRFMSRQINWQTREAFASKVMYTFMTHHDYLERVYTDLDNYILGKQLSDAKTEQTTDQLGEQTSDQVTDQSNQNRQQNKSDSTNITNARTAFSDLPQNRVNIDLNNETMTAAKDNTINKNKQINDQNSSGSNDGESNGMTYSENKSSSHNDTKGSTHNEGVQYRLDDLLKVKGLLEPVYNQFDENCFLW